MAAVPPPTPATSMKEILQYVCFPAVNVRTLKRSIVSSFRSQGANTHIDCFPRTINAMSPTLYHYLPDGLESYDQNAYHTTAAARSFVTSTSTQGNSSNCDHQVNSIVDNCDISPSFTGDLTQFEGPGGQENSIHATSRLYGVIGFPFRPYGTDTSLEPRFTLSSPSPTTSSEHSPTAITAAFSSQPTARKTYTEVDSMYANVQPVPSSIRLTTTSPAPPGTTEHVLNMRQAVQDNAQVRGTLSPATGSYLCAWECTSSPCHKHFTGNRKGLRVHLKEVHGFISTGRESVQCEWNGCGRSLQKENMVRHILSRHMHVKVRCDVCGKDLCRRDVQTMHSKKFCPGNYV
ncbi:hypothetical protein EDC04DRAFT_325070 [Pisolithus marmoratus]|nr:hypothetical protein EDC04DRAFT_325070 [Pisolithus marmoratus]